MRIIKLHRVSVNLMGLFFKREKSKKGKVKNRIALLKRENQNSKNQHCAIGATIQNSKIKIQKSYSLSHSPPSPTGRGEPRSGAGGGL